jgi:hypothetical protein
MKFAGKIHAILFVKDQSISSAFYIQDPDGHLLAFAQKIKGQASFD